MSEILIYQVDNGKTTLEVQLEKDMVWLNQAQLVELFQRDQSVISRHIRNVFKAGELEERSNMQRMHIANSDKPVVFTIWMSLFPSVIGSNPSAAPSFASGKR